MEWKAGDRVDFDGRVGRIRQFVRAKVDGKHQQVAEIDLADGGFTRLPVSGLVGPASDPARQEPQRDNLVFVAGGLIERFAADLNEHGYPTVGSVWKAPIEKLMEIPGIGKITATRLKEEAEEYC